MSYKLYVVPKISTASELDYYQFSINDENKDIFYVAIVGTIAGAVVFDMIPGPAVPG